jgi:hypothetical protein
VFCLPLQLLLQRVEEAPIGALLDDALGGALDQARFTDIGLAGGESLPRPAVGFRCHWNVVYVAEPLALQQCLSQVLGSLAGAARPHQSDTCGLRGCLRSDRPGI